MRSIANKERVALAGLLLAAMSMQGCVHDDDGDMSEVMDATKATYRVTVTNLTNHQPLTPAGAVAHTGGYNAWQLGESASTGLEQLAEGGAVDAWVAEAADQTVTVATVTSSDGPIGPGGSETLTINVEPQADLRLSVATMLANTNDAFSGISDLPIGQLATGEELSTLTQAYDAGTEANSEAAGTIPGPADGGEGFNASRAGDLDRVTVHAGVVTADDGLATSVLDESHRWLGPVAKITVMRVP